MKASISFSEGYRKFQELLKQPLDKLFFNKTKFIDVTGDGILDTCISRIVIKKGEPKITHIILSGGEKIWEDTLTIDDDTGYELYWNYDSSYFKLKPYSGFQIASDLFSTFVMERIDTSSQHFKLISDIIYDLLSKENKKDKIYWQSYLGSFKGRLISKMDEVDIIAYIWDKRYKKFVLYYAP